MLILQDCEADSNTFFFAEGLDSICLKSIAISGHRHFSLRSVRREDDKEIAICIENTDISKIDLDYTKFTLVLNDEEYKKDHYNDWYSAVDKNYLDLIANQENAHNEGGKIKATIEHDKFRGRQSIFGSFPVWIKTWWNNYGLNKVRIVYATLELFLLFIILNLIFLKPIVTSVYVIDGAKKAYGKADTQPLFKKRVQKITLCVLFTGFLFFGLKIDLDKFKLDNVPLVILVIAQFVVGLICLGYLADYIIAK